jgi:hypothetical protein
MLSVCFRHCVLLALFFLLFFCWSLLRIINRYLFFFFSLLPVSDAPSVPPLPPFFLRKPAARHAGPRDEQPGRIRRAVDPRWPGRLRLDARGAPAPLSALRRLRGHTFFSFFRLLYTLSLAGHSCFYFMFYRTKLVARLCMHTPLSTDLGLYFLFGFSFSFSNQVLITKKKKKKKNILKHYPRNAAINRVTIVSNAFGQSKGFAYIEFASQESVPLALDLEGSLFRGRQVQCSMRQAMIESFLSPALSSSTRGSNAMLAHPLALHNHRAVVAFPLSKISSVTLKNSF